MSTGHGGVKTTMKKTWQMEGERRGEGEAELCVHIKIDGWQLGNQDKCLLSARVLSPLPCFQHTARCLYSVGSSSPQRHYDPEPPSPTPPVHTNTSTA